MTKIRRLAAAFAVATGCAAMAAPAPELRRDGPWALTERTDGDPSDRQQLAATPAEEDNDVWLLLVCSRAEVTASLMHNKDFLPSASAQRILTLRAADCPAVTVLARLVQRNQLSIDAAVTRHIFRS